MSGVDRAEWMRENYAAAFDCGDFSAGWGDDFHSRTDRALIALGQVKIAGENKVSD